MKTEIEGVARGIMAIPKSRPVGRVSMIRAGAVHLSGLLQHARLGDRITLHRRGAPALDGEIVQITETDAIVLPETAPVGVAIGDRAALAQGASRLAPSTAWIGRIVDPSGRPLDGKPLMKGAVSQPLRATPPPAARRRGLGSRIDTGLAVTNTFLPIVTGQRVGLFAGSGVGKSRLLAHLARHMEADVVVVAMIGERGRELGQFVRDTLGPEGMARSVVVAATSDESALTRRRCAWAAMTVAEFFRDAGQNVLLLADSVTRFAEAHREIAVAAGEAPALRGYPPSTSHEIMTLCERAGPGQSDMGNITAVFSVLVAGSDMDEPVADILRGVLDGHLVLDREIAERGRYPAINLLRSVSRSLPEAASAAENVLLSEARHLLGAYEQSQLMIKAGLYVDGSDPVVDQAIRIWSDLDAFLARSDDTSVQASFDRLNLILRRARATSR
ncbi:MAG: FliI/YscN family ATPase [Rhodobacteraceae bacterium]|nr:FliI/YscN family ATPase [Paracoccaceae bacterium]